MVEQKGQVRGKQRERLEVLTVTFPGDLTYLSNKLSQADAQFFAPYSVTFKLIRGSATTEGSFHLYT